MKRREAPAAEHLRAEPARQPSPAVAEGKLEDVTGLEVVRLIVLPDRLLQPPVVMIDGGVVTDVAVGIGQELRENVGRLHLKARRKSFLELEHRRMVARMAALVTVTLAGLDVEILRERTQGLRHAAVETRIRLWGFFPRRGLRACVWSVL